MKSVCFLIALLCTASNGADVKCAHFDVKRIFASYEKAIQAAEALSDTRYPMGPGSAKPEDQEVQRCKEKVGILVAKSQQPPSTVDARELLDLQLHIAKVELKCAELERLVLTVERGNQTAETVRKTRVNICSDIAAAANDLARARGYSVILPINSFPETVSIIIADPKSDDVTDELIHRLNTEFRSKGRPGK